MIAVVTGASSGIGREISLGLAGHGYRVVGLARWKSGAPYIGVESFHADLSDTGAAAAAAGEIERSFGPVDVLVHCAGQGAYSEFLEEPAAEFDRLMRVNFQSVVELTRALLPGMLRSAPLGRHLVFVSSMSARYGAWGHAGYAASKGAMRSFAEALRLELLPSGVGCTLVYPGIVATPYFEKGSMRLLWPHVRGRAVSAQRVARGVVGAIGSRRSTVYVPGFYRALDAAYALSPRMAGWMVLKGSRAGGPGGARRGARRTPAPPFPGPGPARGR